LSIGQRVVDLGLRGAAARPGDHICGFFADARQRDEIVLAFLRAGLLAGDKCICVLDGAEPVDIVRHLITSDAGDQHLSRKQLDVLRAADVYLRSERFSPTEIISFWKLAMAEVMYEGRFELVRAVETWALRDVRPDSQELLVLESEMSRFLPLYPQVILCLYDIGRFGGGFVVDLLKTHPRVLVGTMIVENPYYLTPEEFMAARQRPSPSADEDVKELAAQCFAATTGST
jgi:hypothetical protein